MNRELILEVADALERHANGEQVFDVNKALLEFDMGLYFAHVPQREPNYCKTVGCIAGWVIALSENACRKLSRGGGIFTTAMEETELSKLDAVELFRMYSAQPVDFDDISAGLAAKALRSFEAHNTTRGTWALRWTWKEFLERLDRNPEAVATVER